MVHDTQDHIGSAKRDGTSPRSFERVSATPNSAESDSATAATSKGIERGRTIEEATVVIQMMDTSENWTGIVDEDEIEANDTATDIEGGNWFLKTRKGVVPIQDGQLSPMKIRSGKKIGVPNIARQ
ncbi:hypothetical protein FRX31_030081 [Thalictrum thalictroides]|uniref:Uncharacterized protein n=1 Tax=Thalictrum thalictroides TaxID=46969 RepID=A0A7J6V5Z1_THATH|nr:hypothetical protein FRX31_030081 [Thalictrum thalictroides]